MKIYLSNLQNKINWVLVLQVPFWDAKIISKSGNRVREQMNDVELSRVYQ